MNLLFTNFHNGDGGGHTTYIRSLATGLASLHHVYVAAWPSSRLNKEIKLLEDVTSLDQAFPRGEQQWRAWARAWRQLRNTIVAYNIDVVHVNGSADHRLVMRAIRGIKPRPAVVLTQHNTQPLDTLGKRWRARFGTDAVIAVCDYSRSLLERSPYRRCLLYTVHNGIDTDYFYPVDIKGGANGRNVWRGHAELVVGSVAGTQEFKGWLDMVEALAYLPERVRRSVRVLIAGRPPQSTLVERVAALGMQDQVSFVGHLDDIRDMISAVDLGFVLSRAETISFACRETMAMGKPVLCSDAGGLPENVESGVDGWVVPVGDIEAIVDILNCVLARPELLVKMGRNARRRAEASFGLEDFVRKTERVYDDVLAQKKS